MAVVFGCGIFNHFVYGRKITVKTDHRPLIAISQKAIGDMQPRLQRFFFPGCCGEKKRNSSPAMVRGDTGDGNNKDDVELYASSVVSSLVSDSTWKHLDEETRQDKSLKSVLQDLKTENLVEAKRKSFGGQLTQVKGVLLKCCKVAIPASMKREMERIYQGQSAKRGRILSFGSE